MKRNPRLTGMRETKMKSHVVGSPAILLLMNKLIFLLLLIFLILPLPYQRKTENYYQRKEEPKSTTWTNGQLTEFQKELALIQNKDLSYDWTEDIPYKLDDIPYKLFNRAETTQIKPDLVPPGSIVISDLETYFGDESLKQDPQFLPNAIPGENKPVFIPINFTSHLKWLKLTWGWGN